MPRYRIGTELRQAITRFSQRDFAKLAGLNEPQVSRIVNGTPFGPRIQQRIVVAAGILGVSEEQAVKSCAR